MRKRIKVPNKTTQGYKIGAQMHIQKYLQIIMNGKYNIILECENGKHLSPCPFHGRFFSAPTHTTYPFMVKLFLFIIFLFWYFPWFAVAPVVWKKRANERKKKTRRVIELKDSIGSSYLEFLCAAHQPKKKHLALTFCRQTTFTVY